MEKKNRKVMTGVTNAVQRLALAMMMQEMVSLLFRVPDPLDLSENLSPLCVKSISGTL